MSVTTADPLTPADLLVTDELARRPHKDADLAGEVAAFHDLAAITLDSPQRALQRFMELAIALTGAGSAGLSLVDQGAGEFVWEVLAGVYAEHVGGRTPLDFSPCGLCLGEAKTILIDRPARIFDYFNAVTPGIVEGLIVPLYDTGRRELGTLWVVSHDEGTRFCATDARIMEQLAVQLVLALKRRDELREREIDPESELALRLKELTEARAASAFLQTVLNASGDCIKVLDDEGRIIFMNASGLEAIGVKTLEGVAGLRWATFWEDVDGAEQAFRAALNGEAARYDGVRPGPDGAQRWWEVQLTPMRAARGRARQVVAISRDVTEKREAELFQRLMINELNHRVKNSLATVQSVAMQSFRHAGSLDGARTSFEDRLMALSRVHDVLTRENWEGADLRDVVAQAIAPYAGAPGRFEVSGPSVRLTPKQALAISMGLQELATNAVKYGALSRGEGQVRLRWSVRRQPKALAFSWSESGGPRVEPPSRRGFGSRLLERGLGRELSAEVTLAYEPTGVV
ncbi:MAG TPA: HWE histidine kinase domain-containing protein, partial [Caulobacteraceae bacterium]|nr:HWE histidine kinase domain-containing protein [Caulobacteraceae bacterium]